MNDNGVTILDETVRWRARDAGYIKGTWEQIRPHIPEFATEEFQCNAKGPANPYVRTVVRLPRSRVEHSIPVGIVSNSYTLAQHYEIGEKCLSGIAEVGIPIDELQCELGLTELGEWMNLRIYFPDKYDFNPGDDNPLALRLECFNSVDGSSRLVILLGWLRFVCANGLIIGETKVELRDIHNKNMDLANIPDIIAAGLRVVQQDRAQLTRWHRTPVDLENIAKWADKHVTKAWGKKAGCRVFHICESGKDVKLTDPFASGEATEKPVEYTQPVPGASALASNLYDVSQALSFVATGRTNPEQRLAWQSEISRLVLELGVA